MSDIKICQTIDTFFPSVDGAIGVAKHYGHELNKIAECKVAVPKASKKSKYVDKESFEVIRCSSLSAPEGYRAGMPKFDCKFKKRMKAENFDIIHTHSPFTMGRFAVKLAKKNSIPLVATLHTQYHQDFERVFHNFKPLVNIAIKFIVKVFNRADSVWTVSEKSCKFLRDYGYKGKIEVVRNGTDFSYPTNAEELIERVNNAHDLKGQENVFLFVGRMAWYKNLKLLIDGLKIAKDAGKNFKMVFVGGGFDFEDVKKYVQKVGLSDDFIFVGPVKDRELLQGYYLRSDLMLFPSTFDMATVTKEEAAAHKKAALLIRGSCSAELIEDNVNGFLCEETAESFGEKVIELCDKPELVKQAGEHAGTSLYRNWEMVAKDVLERYKAIIEQKKQKASK